MDLYFTKDHEWISVAGGVATVGITDYAQAQIGDIVYVDVPRPGTALAKSREAALVESIKVASDILSPLTGTVVESNGALASEPSLVNVSPEDKGWFFRMTVADPAELDGLLSAQRYRDRVRLL